MTLDLVVRYVIWLRAGSDVEVPSFSLSAIKDKE
jgi:hypothetical protein